VLQRLIEGCDEFLHHNDIDKRVIVKTNGTEARKNRKGEEPLEYFVHPEDVELQCNVVEVGSHTSISPLMDSVWRRGKPQTISTRADTPLKEILSRQRVTTPDKLCKNVDDARVGRIPTNWG
jgi:hypothetical protein